MGKFTYAPFGQAAEVSEAKQYPAPIWPDWNEHSEWSARMNHAKAANDKNFWPTMRQVLAHDAATLPMHRFKVWASTLTVPLVSCHRFKEYITTVLHWAGEDPDRWAALVDPGVGALPEDMRLLRIFDDFDLTMNRVQMVAHLIKTGFWGELGEHASIIELGAGIGEMTDVCYKLGFKGHYSIFDFPELHTIQEYHHQQIGLGQVSYLTEEDIDGPDPLHYDMGIATFSLTEMPLDLREKLMAHVKCDNWLIAYSKQIFGFDNDAWIKEMFVPQFTDHDIEFIEKSHYHRWDGGGMYLTIRKKS